MVTADYRQVRMFTTETPIRQQTNTAANRVGAPAPARTPNRPFTQVLEDQRQWVRAHAPFDTAAKLPIMQFMTIAADESTPAAAALVPFKDAVIQSIHPDQYELTEHALKQLLARLGFDRKLYDKLAGAGRLNALNINYLIQNYYKELVLLRCIDRNKIRAFVTDSFQPFDDLELWEAVAPYMTGAETHFDYRDDEVTHLSVTWPHTETEIKVGDVVKTGIHISNSEVGLRSVTIASYVHRLKCKNGMTSREDGGFFRFRHTGDGDNLRSKIKAAIESAYMETTKLIHQFKESLNKAINDPADYLDKIARDKANTVTQEQYKQMLNALLVEPDISNTLYGVTNSITRVAHEHYTGETRFELERLGHKVLTQGLK